MKRPAVVVLFAASSLFTATQAHAWGPDGHHTVGATADQLIAGTHAGAEVGKLLGGLSLQDAAVWADCAKGISPSHDYAYLGAGKYPECKVFETPEGEAEMADFVRRNDKNCALKTTEDSCHKEYHYSDIAIQRKAYATTLTGAREDDIVAATRAAIRVLKGEAAAAPFNLKNQREALLLLAHYIGDLHQPLHVGAIYLDAAGNPVDPDPGHFDPATDNRGGNEIHVTPGSGKLHHTWDAIPATLKADQIDAAWMKKVAAVRKTPGAVEDWPAAWATQTLKQATTALKPLHYGPRKGSTWPVSLPPDYEASMTMTKTQQLQSSGARLGQILKTIWP